MKSRDKEIRIIRQANRASAVGRLMLGELTDWAEFLHAEAEQLESLPRRMLKAGKADVRKNVALNIQQFCNDNFIGMDQSKLAILYERIKGDIGLEMPLREFEKEYARVKPRVLLGQPKHCTIVISLWGLQIKFPEDFLAKDIIEGLSLNRRAEEVLSKYKGAAHKSLESEKDEIASAVRQSSFGARMCILSCFNLVEAFVNGLAWDFSQNPNSMKNLSKTKRDLIEDGAIRRKILIYPNIITGVELWNEQDEPVKSFLEQVKPFRDALVHPSPFSAQERYGGYDKLKHLYRIDSEKAEHAVEVTVNLISIFFKHVKGRDIKLPAWLQDLADIVDIGAALNP